MRISDWSSDVCSSDLKYPTGTDGGDQHTGDGRPQHAAEVERGGIECHGVGKVSVADQLSDEALPRRNIEGEIGRAHVGTPVTNAHIVCRLLLEKHNKINKIYLHTH